MKRLTRFIVLVMAVLVLGALAVPALADDHFTGIIIPPDAVLYHTDGELNILKPDADGNWYSALTMTDDQLSQYTAAPAADTLIKQVGDLSLYKLTSGEWQLNNGPDIEGKTHVVVFDAGWGSYHSYDLTPYSSSVATAN